MIFDGIKFHKNKNIVQMPTRDENNNHSGKDFITSTKNDLSENKEKNLFLQVGDIAI